MMEKADIFPKKIRWLAIATGAASSLIFFPRGIFFLHPVLLIAGGIIQPRFPSMGRWFVWAGAAGLGVVVITYDILLFRHPLSYRDYVTLIFATILVLWCAAEFVADGRRRMRAHTPVPCPVSLAEWSFATILSLVVVWSATQAPAGYRHSGNFYVLAMSLVNLLIVLAFDLSLLRRVIKLRRA
jgi:hypothetical protein